VGEGDASAADLVGEPDIVARWVLTLTLLLGFAVVGGLTALAAKVYDSVAESDGVATLDQPVLDAAVARRSPTADVVITSFTNLGGTVGMTILATTAAVLIAVARRSLTPVILVAVTAAGSVALTTIGKAMVGRPRPPLTAAVPPFETSFAFPSGHALNSVAIAGMVAYLLITWPGRTRRARSAILGFAVIFAVLMGLSRVYLGHHWLTDVLVAWSVGLAWLTVVIVAFHLFLGVRGNRREAARPIGTA
jgi:membrane-associated phospholipid phosphatase